MKHLRAIFMGSPEIAVPSLRALREKHDVVAVVTQPDQPQGRGRALAAPAVKTAALQMGLVVVQPEKLRAPAFHDQLVAYHADVFVVMAFGRILPAKMLEIPSLGCINVHASLLPEYRGAAPIHWAVLDGKTETGISIMKMDEGLDTGPVYAQRSLPIHANETTGTLHQRLAVLGAEALIDALSEIAAGKLQPTPQDSSRATLARILKKEDGQVDFSWPAKKVDCWIRGMDPWPGAFAKLSGPEQPSDLIKLFTSRVSEDRGAAGEVLAIDQRGALVACGEGAVWIAELQLAGRKRMAAKALAAGRALQRGMHFG